MMEVDRVEQQLQKNYGLKENLFTSGEIQYCDSKKFPGQHFAARFAAKEAYLKALGTGWRNGIKFNEIEIINNKLGKPLIRLHGKALEISQKQKFKNIQISLSHLKSIVNATVIIEI